MAGEVFLPSCLPDWLLAGLAGNLPSFAGGRSQKPAAKEEQEKASQTDKYSG